MIRWDRTQGAPEPIRALNRVAESECGEPLVDLREAAPSVRILREQTIPFCRETVARMAQRAAETLPEGVFLGVTEAWRPLARQQRIYEFMMRSAAEAFPDRSFASLRRTVCRLVAPTDQKAPPGHCTGAALDVNLVDADGNVIDVNAPFDRFQASRTYTLGLSEEAAHHRSLLVRAMLSAGFSNCRDEWWHYSYGDAGWAVRLGRRECLYGRVELDPTLYERQEQLAEEAMRDRPNPFL
ncbi:MAG: hypothetical protein M9921_01550 [Fimbriimonadaceae bacterium]|nr:hypothetical protein [Fimbriimonadaceae bacterium]